MTGQERQTLKQLVSDLRRTRVGEDGLCGWCLEALPDDAHPQQVYCGRSCRSKAQWARTGPFRDREKINRQKREWRRRKAQGAAR